MKKSDLYREWARILDMCEGTNILPIDCLKIDGQTGWHPSFHGNPSVYQFAITILEDEPLFQDDKLYWKSGGLEFDWGAGELSSPEAYIRYLTRNQPKKTFMLNGVELPCPDSEDGYMFSLQGSNQRKNYYFKDMRDRNKMIDAVIDLIEDALK